MNEPLSILLPYQRRWIADQSQVKVSEKSRRIGITWTEAADRALGAAITGRAGIDGWDIGYNKDMALEFIEAAAQWARRFNRAAQAIEEIVLEDERANILAAVESARQGRMRGDRRSRFSRRPAGTAQSRARIYDVGRTGPDHLDS